MFLNVTVKKLLIFYKQNPTVLKFETLDLDVVVLGGLTFVRAYKIFLAFFFVYSFFNNGLYAYTLYFILGCVLTVYVTVKDVRNNLKHWYGTKVFRFLGWNNMGGFIPKSTTTLVIGIGTLTFITVILYVVSESPILP